jgi:hypothetical protein
MWALHLKITFNSETCYEFQARIDACGYSPLQMVPNSQPPLNVNQAASLVAAQCRTGLSALSNYDLENCVLKSSCERLPGCFTNRLRPQQAIVQSGTKKRINLNVLIDILYNSVPSSTK